MNKIEVLAPAGDEESFKTAVSHGANAIYLGLANFNARAKAENFAGAGLRECVKFAHLFGVKIYVTVNTLVKNDEFADFIKLIDEAVEAKVDAFIVQDLGVARLLKSCYKNIELHASTQMGIHNVEGAKIAEQLGFSRVILARETKLEDIKAIKEETELDVEYFVQGALCVAFSGNCYFSEKLNNQSGNRGKCSQLCRLPYSFCMGDKVLDKGYLLSATDLCLLKNLNELIDAGVTSFKIEGRLRRSAYVAQSVDTYRKAVDYLSSGENFNAEKEMRRLYKVFNRGAYNERAYLDKGVPNHVINKSINNHNGVYIGQVVDCKPFKNINEIKLRLDKNKALNEGDGLKFFVNEKEVGSLGVGNVKNNADGTISIFSSRRVANGAIVHQTLDKEFENNLQSIVRKLAVKFDLTAFKNAPLSLKISAGAVSVDIKNEDYICPEAINKATSEEEVVKQLSKLNDTNFEVKDINVRLDNVFIPKSILNDLRRRAVEKLQEEILLQNELNNKIEKNNDKISEFLQKNSENNAKNDKKPTIYIINDNVALDNIENGCIVAYSPSVWSASAVSAMKDKILALNKNTTFALNLPIIANGQDVKIINDIIAGLEEKPILLSNNLWGFKYIDEGYEVIANYNHNIYNNYSVGTLKSLGVIDCVQSIEAGIEIDAYGYVGVVTLMNFCHCPFKTMFLNDCQNCRYADNVALQNEKGLKFKVRRIKISQCYFELLCNEKSETQAKNKIIDLRN